MYIIKVYVKVYVSHIFPLFLKETMSVTMNIFRIKYFLFKAFVKKELLYFHNKNGQYS